jgi:hypothetical protein
LNLNGYEVRLETEDLRLRHLDGVQNIINRLSQNSFTIRGWSVTLASVILAFASSQSGAQGGLVILALVPVWIFWGLDAYYLRQERLFRRLHAAIAKRLIDATAKPDVVPFDMDIEPFQHLVRPWRKMLMAPNVAAIPTALTLITLGVSVFKIVNR